ncbi:hypothetical protein [Streptomyces sp. NPDC003023]|uniref:hypothetical protein n=1 Tax=Streptomyces sp. NPDC003023 TaxID=3364675 RepID=UPI0036CB8F67
MNLRKTGLAALVLTATLLPLVASAGPAPVDDTKNGSRVVGPGLLPALGVPDGADGGASSNQGGDAGAAAADEDEVGAFGEAVPRTTSRCGPELASPGGIDAQTCVLTSDGRTWARTYFRNATGEKLTSVLTLMAPGGRTVQTNCRARTGDDPRTCETPREPSRGPASAYSAVAEFAAHDATGDGRLLLRSGSNSPDPRGG